ncbi:MAG: hypothetical protein M9945_14335 [Aquamicrobium sp.]|uniref:hypothetical protein n=1 Tax=Aquamicrobium sp. TaxID=1872579 RepID=UPI00349EB0FC|nr:hypothetical protein [Aquamicrobium sp.]
MQLPERRYGKFSIEQDVLIQAPDIVRKVMGECVILRAEFRFQMNQTDYEAWSPGFDPVPDGQEPPSYDVVYSDETDTVTWSKQEE